MRRCRAQRVQSASSLPSIGRIPKSKCSSLNCLPTTFRIGDRLRACAADATRFTEVACRLRDGQPIHRRETSHEAIDRFVRPADRSLAHLRDAGFQPPRRGLRLGAVALRESEMSSLVLTSVSAFRCFDVLTFFQGPQCGGGDGPPMTAGKLNGRPALMCSIIRKTIGETSCSIRAGG